MKNTTETKKLLAKMETDKQEENIDTNKLVSTIETQIQKIKHNPTLKKPYQIIYDIYENNFQFMEHYSDAWGNFYSDLGRISFAEERHDPKTNTVEIAIEKGINKIYIEKSPKFLKTSYVHEDGFIIEGKYANRIETLEKEELVKFNKEELLDKFNSFPNVN